MESELRLMDLNEIKPNYAALARKYDLDYRTVKKYHEGYEGKSKIRDKPSKLDIYQKIIADKMQIPRISGKGVYEFLIDQYGLDKVGSYSNFKAYCKKHNIKPKSLKGVGGQTRYETEPGELAQADWKEDIQLTSKYGESFTVNIFHILLKFSRYSYLEITLSKEQHVVFRCLVNAFAYFGGIPKRILFDNMSTIVDVKVHPKRINNKALQFSKDLNFKVNTCKAKSPWTKGSNEARNKILDWIRSYNNEFESFQDLVAITEKINLKMNTEICEGTEIAPCLLYCKEKEYLSPIPHKNLLEQYIAPAKVRVSPQQLIRYKGVQYSVDKRYIGEYVQPEEFNDILHIYYKGKLVQTHAISSNPINYTERHYEQTIEKVIKQEKIESVVFNNLKAMDNLLNMRHVTISKEEACASDEAMIAYLISNNWIRRLIQSLDNEERTILFSEIRKILPFVYDEEQFLHSFKHAINIDNLKHARIDFWFMNWTGNYSFLSEEGQQQILEEFPEEIEEYIKNTYQSEDNQ